MTKYATVDDIDLTRPEFWLDPGRDQAFTKLRRERPVCWQSTNGGGDRQGFWALTRHAEVEHVSRHWKTFCSGYGTSMWEEPVEIARAVGGMLNMDAPEHVRLRRIVNRGFAPKAMANLKADIAACATRVVDAVIERGECDFALDIAQPFPVTVICEMLGAPPEDHQWLQRSTTIALGSDAPELGSDFNNALDAFYALNDYGARLSRERRRSPRDDLITQIVQAEVEGERLSDEEVGVFFQLLVTAGIETTGTALSQGMRALTLFPPERQRWQHDFEGLATTAVEEIVRWSTPVISFARVTTKAVKLAGVQIEAGQKVALWYNTANYDESVFENPAQLDLGRDPNPHVGYGGGGRHFCLGANLARLELKTMFRELLTRLADLELAGDIQYLHSRFINGIQTMRCRFSPGPRMG